LEGFSIRKALPALALGAAFAGTALFTATGLTLAKRTAIVPLVTGLVALIDVTLLLVLVPRAGIVGAAASVAVAYFALAAGMLHASSKVIKINVDMAGLGLVAAILVVQTVICTKFAGSSIVIVSLLAASGLVLAADPDARAVFASRRNLR
jgi:O-antigen/teichoic acid export membrane protein